MFELKNRNEIFLNVLLFFIIFTALDIPSYIILFFKIPVRYFLGGNPPWFFPICFFILIFKLKKIKIEKEDICFSLILLLWTILSYFHGDFYDQSLHKRWMNLYLVTTNIWFYFFYFLLKQIEFKIPIKDRVVEFTIYNITFISFIYSIVILISKLNNIIREDLERPNTLAMMSLSCIFLILFFKEYKKNKLFFYFYIPINLSLILYSKSLGTLIILSILLLIYLFILKYKLLNIFIIFVVLPVSICYLNTKEGKFLNIHRLNLVSNENWNGKNCTISKVIFRNTNTIKIKKKKKGLCYAYHKLKLKKGILYSVKLRCYVKSKKKKIDNVLKVLPARIKDKPIFYGNISGFTNSKKTNSWENLNIVFEADDLTNYLVLVTNENEIYIKDVEIKKFKKNKETIFEEEDILLTNSNSVNIGRKYIKKSVLSLESLYKNIAFLYINIKTQAGSKYQVKWNIPENKKELRRALKVGNSICNGDIASMPLYNRSSQSIVIEATSYKTVITIPIEKYLKIYNNISVKKISIIKYYYNLFKLYIENTLFRMNTYDENSFDFLNIFKKKLLKIFIGFDFEPVIKNAKELRSFEDQDRSTYYRNKSNDLFIKSFINNPVYGIGLKKAYRIKVYKYYSHTYYLFPLVAYGLIGMIPYILFFIYKCSNFKVRNRHIAITTIILIIGIMTFINDMKSFYSILMFLVFSNNCNLKKISLKK